MVPHRQPVVEPERQTDEPTAASVEPATGTVPGYRLTRARGVLPAATLTHA
jgi:hypothetical protein